MDYFSNIIKKIKKPKSKNFHVEITTNGFLPYNTSTIKIICWENVSKKKKIKKINYKWYKKIENRNYKLENDSNFYYFSYKDVGYKIILICEDSENPHQMEISEFGPILLDPQTKIDLEGMIINEKGIFEVELPFLENKFKICDEKRKIDLKNLKVSDIILDPYNLNFFINEKKFFVKLKKFEIDSYYNSPLIIKIIFKEKENFLEKLNFTENENGDFVIYIKFFTRVFKENFCVLYKLFLEVRLTPFLKELEHFESIQQDQNLFKNNIKTSTGDILLIFSNFKNMLKKNINYTKKILEERDTILKYSESLENDLKMTLAEYKETFYKTKFENKKVNLSKIEKMENSLIKINLKKKENSFQIENLENLKMNENRYIKIKNDYEKMKKLNKLLVKELKKIKNKKKDKFKKINQSLTNLKNLSEIANQIKSQSFLENSNFSEILENEKNFVNFKKKKTLEEIKEENDDISELQKKNEILKNQIISLKTEKITNSQKKKNSPKKNFFENENLEKENIFLKNCLNDFRKLIEEIISGKKKEDLKKSYLNDSIIESVYNAGVCNKIELLNIENSLLLRRIKFLSGELNLKKNSFENNFEENYEKLYIKIEELKKENVKLMKEIDRLENIEKETEDIYKKQNIVLKFEIEKLKKNKFDDKNKKIEELQIEVDEKDQMIDQMGKTNSKLIEEIQKLQDLVYNQSLRDSHSELKSFNQ